MKRCSYCSYKSLRQYNLDRHIYTTHCDKINEFTNNVSLDNTNVSFNNTNVSLDDTNVSLDGISTHTDDIDSILGIYKCEKCYKDFISKHGFKLHQLRCKSIQESLECKYCHQHFVHRSSKSRHEKKCENKHKQITLLSDENVIIQPLQGTTIHNTTNNIQININLLTYPTNGEYTKNFDFLRNHITGKQIKKMFEGKPEIGFSKYIYSIFDRPENRIIHKTHPNNNYSKVHIGEGKWALELDEDVYTVMTHFLTCAALQSTEEHKQFIRTMEQNIKAYLDDVNTQNDENNNYGRAMQRVRLIIVNLTTKWKKDGLIQG